MKIPIFYLLTLMTFLTGCAMPFRVIDSNPAPVSLSRSFDANQGTRDELDETYEGEWTED